MKRAQFYLREGQIKTLNRLSRRMKLNKSLLVREALDRTFPRLGELNFEKVLREVSGIWKDRDDIGPTEELLKRFR